MIAPVDSRLASAQVAGAHAPVLIEDVQAARVGPVDPEQHGHQLVDHVGGALAGPNLVAKLGIQLFSLIRKVLLTSKSLSY